MMPLPSNGERAPARFWQNSAQSNFSPMAAIMNAAPCTTFYFDPPPARCLQLFTAQHGECTPLVK